MGEKEQGSIGEDERGSIHPLVVDGIATKPVQVAFQRTSGHMGASDLAIGDQGTVEDKQNRPH